MGLETIVRGRKVLIKIDDWLLNRFDSLVLWFWNFAGVRRIQLIRATAIGWAISTALYYYLEKGKLVFEGFASPAAVLLILLPAQEIRSAQQTPSMANAFQLVYRVIIVSRVCRMFWLWILVPGDILFEVYEFLAHKPETAFNILSGLAGFLYFFLTYTLTPEGPRKKKPKKALAPEGNLVFGES